MALFTVPALQAKYDNAYLVNFRNALTDADARRMLASLDARIASFENVLLGTPSSGTAGADYPYDRANLRLEFLEEVFAIIARTGTVGSSGSVPFGLTVTSGPSVGTGEKVLFHVYSEPGLLSLGFKGVKKGVLANMTEAQKKEVLGSVGANIYDAYSDLIDSTFNHGNTLGNNPGGEQQVVTAIPPLTVPGDRAVTTDDRTYDRLAVTTNISTGASTLYLLEHTATNAKVTKSASGAAVLNAPASGATAQRIRLDLQKSSTLGSLEYVAVDGKAFYFVPTASGFRLEDGVGRHLALTSIPPIALPLPGKEATFPDDNITINYRTSDFGIDYLIGRGTDDKYYVTSLAAKYTSAVGSAASLSGLEYLLYFNEARIKILRAKLAYNEAVVREIQDDLRQANDALADLEKQAGLVKSLNSDNSVSTETSTETTKLNMFNAVASTAGSSIMDESTESFGTVVHKAGGWTKSRVSLKNYIDRRSAEAQQATLDYQNTLNRFNSAYEIMAKLQEKIDNLLSGQLRNLG